MNKGIHTRGYLPYWDFEKAIQAVTFHLADSVPAIQRQYNLVQSYYGAASRQGSPPIPLQGVWSADNGKIPAWFGDYHHDLNTELTYWA
jgi:hypothetical protein